MRAVSDNQVTMVSSAIAWRVHEGLHPKICCWVAISSLRDYQNIVCWGQLLIFLHVQAAAGFSAVLTGINESCDKGRGVVGPSVQLRGTSMKSEPYCDPVNMKDPTTGEN